jgi:hypothetical protein
VKKTITIVLNLRCKCGLFDETSEPTISQFFLLLGDGCGHELRNLRVLRSDGELHGDALREGELGPDEDLHPAPEEAGEEEGVRALALTHLVGTLARLHNKMKKI